MPKDRMLTKREITTYAEVLLEATRSSDTMFEVSGQLKEAKAVVLKHPGLRDSLGDATLPAEVRSNIAIEVFRDFDPSLVKVLAVMAERCDMDLLPQVAEDFGLLAEDALGVLILDVTTVVELDDALREKIKSKFAAQLGKKIMLREYVNPALIGGIVLGAHGKRIDASIASQLEKARVVLSSVTTGGER